ncbi:MAG TPA: TonB-dependent receptor plug domain-containing protein, partial [Sediminibacterium sp.]|nr:TonB-dependent receptor plug domain-containing protein [Sediminibacterium sp.]
MRTCLNKIFFLFSFLLVSLTVMAGGLRGKVNDSQTGEPLAGATVEIEMGKVKLHAIVNLDGSYAFKEVPAGRYSIKIKLLGYQTVAVGSISVADNTKATVFNALLQPETIALQNVTVSSEGKESDRSVRGLEKVAPVLENILSQKTIELLPDVTVANALQRVSGVSIQRSTSGEGRYAIIRGMDERYNNTLVNGVKIPSPDAKYRYVPMDLFPSDMLERLEVIKSLTPSMEGDAVGGTMNLVMKSAPQHFLFNANLATGFSGLFSASRP